MGTVLPSEHSGSFTLTVGMRCTQTTCYTTSKTVAEIVHVINKGRQESIFHLIQKRAVSVAMAIIESLSILQLVNKLAITQSHILFDELGRYEGWES